MKKLNSNPDYKTIIETAPDGFWLLDINGKFLEVNQSYCNISGYSRDELLSMGISDIEVIEKESNTKKRIKKIIEIGYDSFESKHRKKDGSIIDVEINTKYLDKDGGIFYVFIKDITKKIAMEKSYIEIIKKYENLFNKMITGIALHEIICDKNGKPIDYKFLDVNSQFEKFTGLKKENLINKTVLEVLPKTEKYWIEKYGEVALTGKTITFDNFSQELNRHYQVTAFSHEKGKFIVAFTDITKHKKIEEIHKERSHFIESIINLSPDIIYIYDLINKKNIYSNNGVEKVLGYTTEEIKQMGDNLIHILMHPDDMKTYIDEILPKYEKLATDELLTHEYRMKHKNGEWKYLQSKEIIYSKSANEKIFQIFGVIHDISENKKLQNQLVQSEKLSAVGQLTAGIAHEFNNILAIISINSQLIQLNDCKHYLEDCKNSIDNINNSVLKGKKIVENMMSFAKPQNPKKHFYRIEEIIETVLKLQRTQIELEHIEISTHYETERKIFVDAGQIEQVFTNLLINARHAIKPKKKGRIKINITEKNNFIKIVVSDNGIGMNNETLKNIFNPFYSTKGAYSKNNLGVQGSGLGLSVSHTIIQNHNGTIEVKSQENVGSEFIIKLPIEKSTEINVQDDKKNININSELNKSILLIDDEKEFLSVTKKILEKFHCRVDVSETALKGIEYAKNNKYDVIFLDMLLPDMSGEDIFKKIKEFNKETSIVFISGQVGLENDKLNKIGADGYLQKPFDIQELKQIINEI